MKITVSVPIVMDGWEVSVYDVDELPAEFEGLSAREQVFYLEAHHESVSDNLEVRKFLDCIYEDSAVDIER
jgi:hypothetical protein